MTDQYVIAEEQQYVLVNKYVIQNRQQYALTTLICHQVQYDLQHILKFVSYRPRYGMFTLCKRQIGEWLASAIAFIKENDRVCRILERIVEEARSQPLMVTRTVIIAASNACPVIRDQTNALFVGKSGETPTDYSNEQYAAVCYSSPKTKHHSAVSEYFTLV